MIRPDRPVMRRGGLVLRRGGLVLRLGGLVLRLGGSRRPGRRRRPR